MNIFCLHVCLCIFMSIFFLGVFKHSAHKPPWTSVGCQPSMRQQSLCHTLFILCLPCQTRTFWKAAVLVSQSNLLPYLATYLAFNYSRLLGGVGVSREMNQMILNPQTSFEVWLESPVRDTVTQCPVAVLIFSTSSIVLWEPPSCLGH